MGVTAYLENGFQCLHQAGNGADVLDVSELHLVDPGLGGLCTLGVLRVGVGAVDLHAVGIPAAITTRFAIVAFGGCIVQTVVEAVVSLLDLLFPRAPEIVEQVLGDCRHGGDVMPRG